MRKGMTLPFLKTTGSMLSELTKISYRLLKIILETLASARGEKTQV